VKDLSKMSDREALIDFFRLTSGKYWYQKWFWESNQGYKQWYGVDVDKAGHVTSICLRENYLQGSLEHFHTIKLLVNLSVLSIFSNLLTGPLPSEIGKLFLLRELNLSWNKFSGPLPDSFYDLKELAVIKIDHNQFEGEISEKFGELIHLKFVNVSFNRFTGSCFHFP
jgi:hypothetical protein